MHNTVNCCKHPPTHWKMQEATYSKAANHGKSHIFKPHGACKIGVRSSNLQTCKFATIIRLNMRVWEQSYLVSPPCPYQISIWERGVTKRLSHAILTGIIAGQTSFAAFAITCNFYFCSPCKTFIRPKDACKRHRKNQPQVCKYEMPIRINAAWFKMYHPRFKTTR